MAIKRNNSVWQRFFRTEALLSRHGSSRGMAFVGLGEDRETVVRDHNRRIRGSDKK
jgi:hypothetical protein